MVRWRRVLAVEVITDAFVVDGVENAVGAQRLDEPFQPAIRTVLDRRLRDPGVERPIDVRLPEFDEPVRTQAVIAGFVLELPVSPCNGSSESRRRRRRPATGATPTGSLARRPRS